jgi:hypothetical protein
VHDVDESGEEAMTWWQILLTVWAVSVPLTFYVQTKNVPIIRMGEFVLMVVFGPLALLVACHDLDTILWERKKQ